MIRPNYNSKHSTSCKPNLTTAQKIRGCKKNIQQCKDLINAYTNREIICSEVVRKRNIKRYTEQAEVYKHALKRLQGRI